MPNGNDDVSPYDILPVKHDPTMERGLARLGEQERAAELLKRRARTPRQLSGADVERHWAVRQKAKLQYLHDVDELWQKGVAEGRPPEQLEELRQERRRIAEELQQDELDRKRQQFGYTPEP